MSTTTCLLCDRAGRQQGRMSGRSKICQDCHAMLRASGRAWCARCERVCQRDQVAQNTRYCRLCRADYLREYQQPRRPLRAEAENAARRERYRTDPAYRAQCIASARRSDRVHRLRYRIDPDYRAQQLAKRRAAKQRQKGDQL